jgi:hypothetical protein
MASSLARAAGRVTRTAGHRRGSGKQDIAAADTGSGRWPDRPAVRIRAQPALAYVSHPGGSAPAACQPQHGRGLLNQ